jgi:hypothetical protein
MRKDACTFFFSKEDSGRESHYIFYINKYLQGERRKERERNRAKKKKKLQIEVTHEANY